MAQHLSLMVDCAAQEYLLNQDFGGLVHYVLFLSVVFCLVLFCHVLFSSAVLCLPVQVLRHV